MLELDVRDNDGDNNKQRVICQRTRSRQIILTDYRVNIGLALIFHPERYRWNINFRCTLSINNDTATKKWCYINRTRNSVAPEFFFALFCVCGGPPAKYLNRMSSSSFILLSSICPMAKMIAEFQSSYDIVGFPFFPICYPIGFHLFCPPS